jgi:hypothetical protein
VNPVSVTYLVFFLNKSLRPRLRLGFKEFSGLHFCLFVKSASRFAFASRRTCLADPVLLLSAASLYGRNSVNISSLRISVNRNSIFISDLLFHFCCTARSSVTMKIAVLFLSGETDYSIWIFKKQRRENDFFVSVLRVFMRFPGILCLLLEATTRPCIECMRNGAKLPLKFFQENDPVISTGNAPSGTVRHTGKQSLPQDR